MSSTDKEEWWLVEAGEYVLGTLRGPERDLFEKLLERDSDARSMVYFWETHLATLDSVLAQQSAQSVATSVPRFVWEEITRRLDDLVPSAADTTSISKRAVKLHVNGIDSAANRLPLWRFAAVASMVASVALGALVLNQFRLNPVMYASENPTGNPVGADIPAVSAGVADDLDVVAVLSDEEGAVLWLVVADETDGSLRAIALQTPAQSDTQSHQLWVLLPDDGGVESVGLLPYRDGSSRTYQLSSEAALERLRAGVAFAISVEPAGGTKSGGPTGPVISSSAFTRVDDAL